MNKKIHEILSKNIPIFTQKLAYNSEELINKILKNKENIEMINCKHLDQIVICCILSILKYKSELKQELYEKIKQA